MKEDDFIEKLSLFIYLFIFAIITGCLSEEMSHRSDTCHSAFSVSFWRRKENRLKAKVCIKERKQISVRMTGRKREGIKVL